MVIAVTKADIEGYTTEEFLQISLYICTALNNKVDYIQIAMPGSCIVTSLSPNKVMADAK